MEQVGDRQLFFSGVAILPDGEAASFDATVRGAEMLVRIVTAVDTANTLARSESRIEAGRPRPTITITLINWTSSFVQTFARPLQAGALGDGTPIGYNVAVLFAGGPRVILVQLYAGGTY